MITALAISGLVAWSLYVAGVIFFAYIFAASFVQVVKDNRGRKSVPARSIKRAEHVRALLCVIGWPVVVGIIVKGEL